MPTWDEICQVLEQLRTLIEEIQSDLADPATVQERRPGLQQLLTACFATWDEIVEKYAERPRRGKVSNSHLQAFPGRPGRGHGASKLVKCSTYSDTLKMNVFE